VGITVKAHKLLWGASGNTCAKCKNVVVHEATATDGPSIVGEEAHIASKETKGPGYDDPLPMDKRDGYENLLILCNRCHKIVDDQVNTYAVGALRRMKSEHEEWVRNVLSSGGSVSTEHDWKVYQASSISSCSYLIPLRLQSGSDEVEPAIVDPLKDELHQWIALAFGHACIKTPFDDFVYLMSLERIDGPPKQGLALFELSLLGKLVPHRIRRLPPGEIGIQPFLESPKRFDRVVTTSILLHLMAKALTKRLILWDGVDKCPDLMKVLSMAARTDDRRRFSILVGRYSA
jgi:hypothetical protein